MSSDNIEELLAQLQHGADCRRSKVSAVVVSRGGEIVGRGWNGLLRGSCLAGDCPRGRVSYAETPAGSDYTGNCEALHAEVSALREAGVLAHGGTIYVTRQPCEWCASAIADASVAAVVVTDTPNRDVPVLEGT